MRPLVSLLALALCGLLSSCGADSFLPLGTVTGNWQIYNVYFAQGGGVVTTPIIGGPITQVGNTLSASLHIDIACFGNGQTAIPLTGSINPDNAQFTLTSPSVGGEIVLLKGTFAPSRNTFDRGYLSINGDCTGYLVSQTGDDGGAITNPRGLQIPSLSGSWAFAESFPGPTLSEQLTQSPTPDSQGRFTLTGTASVSGSPCFTTGTLQPGSYVTGTLGQQIILLNDGSTFSSPIMIYLSGGSPKPTLQLYPGTITGGNCNGPANIDLR
jgi:hypothetical protein